MSKGLSTMCVSAALALLAVATESSAQDACIQPKVEEALFACPKDAQKQAAAKHSPARIALLPPAQSKGQPRPAPPDPTLSAAQIRRGLASVRQTQLLVTQIQGLESLLAQTAANSPDRPGLVRRLGDSYVELEASAFRAKIENRIKAQNDPAKAAGFNEEAKKAEKIEVAARNAAIKQYNDLKARHPGYCQSPNPTDPSKAAGCIDETLYNLAYEYEQAGDLDKARKTYFELIQSAPSSKYIPNAYLAFGELFFQEAQGDPTKWALAEQSYKQVTRYPAPGNTVFAYAQYKLAYVHWNTGDHAQALSAFKKTIEAGMSHPTLPNAAQLAASARRDMLPVYALAGDAKKAHDLFAPLSGATAADPSRTYRMLADLGQSYLDIGRFREAIDLYSDLQKRDRGPRTCDYQAHITEATLALKSGDKTTAKAALDRQLEVEQTFASGNAEAQQKRACSNVTASLAVETAMSWHLEAVGNPGVRGTADPRTMAFSADLYEKVVRRFTAADFANFEFPRIVKEDWPTTLKIKYALGDLLYFQKEWARCGVAFDAVVAEDPRGPQAGEAGFASAICYQNAYLAAHAGRSAQAGLGAAASGNLAPKELGQVEKSMLASFDRFLCAAKPAAGDKEAKDRYVDVAYARARTYFEARRFPEAAAAFREIALNHADHEAGMFAGQLYLESLNVMLRRGAPACLTDMGRDTPKLFDLYCKGDKGKGVAEQCASLAKVKREVQRAGVEDMLSGNMNGPEGLRRFEQGAMAYLQIWTESGQAACEAGEPACERMDEILYNSAKAFTAARLLAKAIAVRKILVDPRYHLEKTELGKKSVYDIAQNYQAMAVYDEAATWYERYARENPAAEKAPQALEDALVLRFGMGQDDQAMKIADLFERSHARKHPALAAQVAFAVGAHFAEHGSYAQARRSLQAAMPTIDRSGTLDVQIQAHATLGRAIAKINGDGAAAAEYAKVRSLFKDPRAAAARIMAGGDESANTKRLAKTLTAVGEAMYFFAEQKRKEVDKIRFPEYKGSGRRDDVLAHVKGKVADWIKKKRPAIEEAEQAYLEVLRLEPVPPPKWVIAAGARSGQMWSKFVAEFRAAPTPSEWKQPGMSPSGVSWEEIRATYEGAINEASEPQRQRAKAAFKRCLADSVKYQHFDEHSRACELWLSRTFPSEFHAVDELRDAPSRTHGASLPPPAPLAAQKP